MENVNFYTFDGFCLPVSRSILLKPHILARLIESFLTTYAPKSCNKEKLSIPLKAHPKGQFNEIFLSYLAKK